jgi:hypothetical protein
MVSRLSTISARSDIKAPAPREFKRVLEKSIKQINASKIDAIEQAILFSWSNSDVGLVFVGNGNTDVYKEIAKTLEDATSVQVNYLYYSSAEFQRRIARGDPFLKRVIECPIWLFSKPLNRRRRASN